MSATLEKFVSLENLSGLDWEAAFAPYDEQTYRDALALLNPNDIVLDIGAGDLRFAKRAAERVTQVIAIEQRVELIPENLPCNIQVICGDAREIEFPKNISVAILLMRHCQHFSHYREKLERVGCKKLITNARWGMDVELIDLDAPRLSFSNFDGGWYACQCGAVGFKVTNESVQLVAEVRNCPACLKNEK